MLEEYELMKSSDLEKINQENRNIWNDNSIFWDNKIGNGNSFQENLIEPNTIKLIDFQNDKNVLDIACGAGRFARKMVEKGYFVVDVTDENQLLKLGENNFDLATCSMAIMDIPIIEPLIKSLKILLK